MPTPLNSRQLARLDATTRRLSFFSATVEDAHLLQGLREMVQAGIDEGLPETSAVSRMRQWIRETRSAATGQSYLGDRSGWTAEEKRAYENSVKHIDSLARLRLIFRTQAEMGAGYNQWQEGYSRLSLVAYPGWRFYRRPGAKTFRADHVEHDGQVRLKTDLPYWLARNRVEIGGFANPWPPFGYNSWMWIAPVSRAECEKLGLLKPGEGIVPLTDEQADTWGVPRLMQKTLGERSGRVLDAAARQHVINTCEQHGFDVYFDEVTGKFVFGKKPPPKYPTLVGSEKQIKWAEDIRQKRIKELDKYTSFDSRAVLRSSILKILLESNKASAFINTRELVPYGNNPGSFVMVLLPSNATADTWFNKVINTLKARLKVLPTFNTTSDLSTWLIKQPELDNLRDYMSRYNK